MKKIFNTEDTVEWGEDHPLLDWRKAKEDFPQEMNEDPDDDDSLPTPPDVVGTLGFDPAELYKKAPKVIQKGGPGSGIVGHTTPKEEDQGDWKARSFACGQA